jgi:4-hydroxybenzoate polyprenyltransferase
LPLQAFLLVVLASFSHSTWNILRKRATDTKHLLLFSSVLEALLFIPAAVYGLTESWLVLGWKTWLLLLAIGVLHLLYSESLLRGY